MQRSLVLTSILTIAGIFALLISFGEHGNAAPQAARRVARELLEKRLAAARNVFEVNFKRLQTAELEIGERLMWWSERWLNSQLALTEKHAERVAALQAHLKRIEEIERVFAAYVKAGQGRTSDAEAATYFRIEAEIRLMEVEQN